MKGTIWDKRIPTLLVILLIVVGLGVTTFLLGGSINLIGKAGGTSAPENIKITNISDTSFTVTYTTEDAQPATVSFGKDKESTQTVLDDRDTEKGSVTSYKLHHITVKNLAPSTKYFFTITNGQTTYMNNGIPFDVTTASALSSSIAPSNELKGKALLPDGTSPPDAIVFITTDGGQMLSALVGTHGEYAYPLNTMRISDFSSYVPLSPSSVIYLTIIGPSSQSNGSLFFEQANSVPTIILSKDYDFTIGNSEITPALAGSLLPIKTEGERINTPQIIAPKRNESFSDQKPLFKGTASPGTTVQITIESQEKIQAQTTVDRNGNWSYRPSSPLSPGQHIISIQVKDQFGILKTITQSFTVYAQGSSVSQSATPSATPITTPTSIPTSFPTPTPIVPTVIATPSPTLFIFPTPTIIIPIVSTSPSVGSDLVSTSGILALITTVVGITLFLITRGSGSL